MIQQKAEVEYLIYLLSCAIKEEKAVAKDDIDYSALLKLSKKHQVYNIIVGLIKDFDCVSDELKEKFKNFNLSEVSRMIVVNNERELIFDELDEKGIKYMPLKGLVIRNYYPKVSMRQMSDNDILFDVNYRDDVAKIMKDNGYVTTATGENSDDYHKAPYSTFEFHRNLFFKGNGFCPSFDNLWENSTKNEERPYMYDMGVNDIYTYSVCHMYKHFSSAGCGIRFLVDNYLILKKEENNLDWDYINNFFDKIGIADFEKQCRNLALKLFDNIELNDDENDLFEVFINNGIFGDYKIRISKTIQSMVNDDVDIKKAKKQYILYRLFPPKEKMIADYRVLEKKPYLLFAYYIFRLFKALINGKKSLSEFSDINNIES